MVMNAAARVTITTDSAVLGISFASLSSKAHRALFLGLILILNVFPLSLLMAKYQSVTKHLIHGTPIPDTSFEIAEYLRSQDVEGHYLYFTSNHIGYWLTGTLIPTRQVHPSNVSRNVYIKVIEGPDASSTTELGRIFSKKPLFVIRQPEIWYATEEFITVLDAELTAFI